MKLKGQLKIKILCFYETSNETLKIEFSLRIYDRAYEKKIYWQHFSIWFIVKIEIILKT